MICNVRFSRIKSINIIIIYNLRRWIEALYSILMRVSQPSLGIKGITNYSILFQSMNSSVGKTVQNNILILTYFSPSSKYTNANIICPQFLY